MIIIRLTRSFFQLLVCCALSFEVAQAQEVETFGTVEVEEACGETIDDGGQILGGRRDFGGGLETGHSLGRRAIVGRVEVCLRREIFGWHCRFLI